MSSLRARVDRLGKKSHPRPAAGPVTAGMLDGLPGYVVEELLVGLRAAGAESMSVRDLARRLSPPARAEVANWQKRGHSPEKVDEAALVDAYLWLRDNFDGVRAALGGGEHYGFTIPRLLDELASACEPRVAKVSRGPSLSDRDLLAAGRAIKLAVGDPLLPPPRPAAPPQDSRP
jgi:hypothetical protein